jgi:hypothetical protein
VSKDASDAFVPKPYEERKQEIRNILVGKSESDCAFSLTLFQNPPNVNCYGPVVKYDNYPGGGGGQLPIGDVGIWATYEIADDGAGALASTGEACAAAKMNSAVSYVSSKVDTATDMFAGMLCMANVDGDNELPEINATKDLKSSLEKVAADIGGLTISEATVSRLADTAEGYAVYLSHVSADVAMENGKSAVMDINLKHIPEDAENTAYKGKLWTTFKSENGDMSEQGTKQFASSVLYSKDSSGNLSYHIRSGDYDVMDVDPFDAKYNVDPSKKHANPTPDSEGWNANFQMGTFSIGADGTTSVSYSWQAGPADRATRTFIATSSGTLGTGYYGYGPDVVANDGAITGFYCHWAGEASAMSDEERAVVIKDIAQRQLMTFDASTGKFIHDNTDGPQFLYPPDTNCLGANNFTYYADYGAQGMIPVGVVSNDKREAGGNDLKLVDLSTVPAPPTAPADIE